MRRVLLFLPLVLFLGIAIYFALGLRRDPSVLPSALIDQPVPSFELPPLLDGTPSLRGGDLKGKVQLVNVFASWCAPCRIEHPALMRLAQKEGVTLHGIAYKDKPEDSRRFLEQLGNPFTHIGVDRDGRAAIEWGVYGVPETYVVDAQGRIRYRHVGPILPQDWDMLTALIRELRE